MLGNINTGKSTLFDRLVEGCAEPTSVSGSPSTLARGVLHHCSRRRFHLGLWSGRVRPHQGCPLIYDSPGTATLLPQTDEEASARDALLQLRPEALLLVADAKNVRRSLALTLHAAELGLPMVMAVNMGDEASRRGIGVDVARLSRALGIEVISTVASEGDGVEAVRAALDEARTPRSLIRFPQPIVEALERLEAQLEPAAAELPCSVHGMALLLLGGDEVAFKVVAEALGEESSAEVRALVDALTKGARRSLAVTITDLLYEAAERLAAEVVRREAVGGSWMDRLGDMAEHRLWGPLIALAVVAAMYLWVGVLGATIVVDALDEHLFRGLLMPLFQWLVEPIPVPVVREAMMDPDFGVLPTGLFLAFGIVLPVLFFFFFAFGMLQSSGYLARLSVLLDRIFRRVGLNGQGVMPLVMGFSCVTMALITTRMLDSRRERLIASFLLLGLPCAPLLAVMMVVLGEMPLSASLVVFGVLGLQKVVGGVWAARLLPGRSPDFIMVIPPMRLPRIGHVLAQTLRQTYAFMKEAVPLFVFAALLLFTFDRVGGLAVLERVARPLTGGLLQLPDQAVQVFIKALVRRESGATELALVREQFTNLQLVVTLLVMATIVPCVNAAIVLVKERGLRDAAAIAGLVMVFSLAVGAAVSHLCTTLGITFT